MRNVVFLLVVLFLFAGCSNSTSYSSQDTTKSTNIESLDINPVCYLIEESEENIVTIPIPRIGNMSTKEITFIQKYIREKIQLMTGAEFALSSSHKSVENKDQAYSQYLIIMDSQATYVSDTLVSIVFEGFINQKNSAHPMHCLFSLNYNPQTLKIVTFSEKYTIDHQLYLVFADFAEKALMQECAGVLPAGWESFRDPICAESVFLAGINSENELCYYAQDTGIVISYSVPFSIGNHKEVLIPYNYLVEK